MEYSTHTCAFAATIGDMSLNELQLLEQRLQANLAKMKPGTRQRREVQFLLALTEQAEAGIVEANRQAAAA